MAKFYTGVGSRDTPEEVLKLMRRIGFRMAQLGYTGRSGLADGADRAFYDGFCQYERQTKRPKGGFVNYLPWLGFNGGTMQNPCNVNTPTMANYRDAMEIASELHPAWGRLTRGPRALHTRNIYQVLGHDLKTNSKVLICWAPRVTPNGVFVKGGTNSAVKLAWENGISIYNLWVPEQRAKLLALLGFEEESKPVAVKAADSTNLILAGAVGLLVGGLLS